MSRTESVTNIFSSYAYYKNPEFQRILRQYNKFMDEWNNPDTTIKHEEFEEMAKIIKDDFYIYAAGWLEANRRKYAWLRKLR